MIETLRGALYRLLRVPPDPYVPAGESEHIRVFRAAPTFYRYNLLRWALGQIAALSLLVAATLVMRAATDSPDASPNASPSFDIAAWLGAAASAVVVAQLLLTYAALRLDYDLRWYILTPRSLRIREGLLRIREQTMTFANIQNMSIRQGPLQRLLGIADVEVHTAGGGSGSQAAGTHRPQERLHVGTLRGVDNAEEVRAAIQARVRLHRDAGLGDPDDVDPAWPIPSPGGDEDAAGEGAGRQSVPSAGPPVPELDVLHAARTLLDEVRRLREAM